MSRTIEEPKTANAQASPEVGQELPTQMQAIVYDRYGDADRLHLAEVKTPRWLPGTVVIRVHAAGINPIDYRLRSGEARWVLPGGFPRIPGYDVAGEIVEGDAEQQLFVGDRVLAFLNSPYGGGYAPYARCAISGVAKIPDAMTYKEAAALPLAGSTALQGLRDKGAIKPGDRVLINGASGGVGGFAVQIAKAYGAHVTAVASGKHEDYVRSIGADDFISYEKQQFTKLGRSWQLIFDVVGNSSFWKSRRVLAKYGRFVSTEPSVRGTCTSLATRFLSRQSNVMLVRPESHDLHELVQLYQKDQLSVELADVMPLEQAAEAHRRLEAGGHCGKYVLIVDEED